MLTTVYHALKDRFGFLGDAFENRVHTRAALDWIYRAQDATPDRGVSHSYRIGKGWKPSYPETTGYIIPTLLNWNALTGEDEARRRALEMAEWEIGVQSPTGAIPGLSDGKPVVFDTGQVLFGWLAAWRETRNEEYLKAAIRGADWLVAVMDETGAWTRYGNPGTKGPNLYNVRVAWGMAELAVEAGRPGYREAAARVLDWALAQEVQRGWFRHNCLNDNDRPLLHTIAYTSQGLLETGIALGDHRSIEASIRTSDELLKHVAADGRMPGRYDRNWHGAARWCCLTGMAQTSIVWRRLAWITGKETYRQAASDVNRFLKRTQDLRSPDPGIRGGIKGSFPFGGAYGKYSMLNWAAKFFVDALILEEYPGFGRPLW